MPEPPAAAPAVDDVTSRQRWAALAVLSVGFAMTIVDATIVNVALPVMIEELGISLSTAEWINTLYLLAFAGLIITMGRLSDLVGRRRIFLVGIVSFAGASLASGLAPNGGILLAARLVQGAGAAAILPSALDTVNVTFKGRERALAFGVWGSVIGGMAAFGPLIGGWLTTSFSWRWAFYVNVPIGVLVVVGAFLIVPASRAEDVGHGFDLTGLATSAIGLGALVFALVEGRNYGWWAPKQALSVGGLSWPSQGVSIIPVAFLVAVIALVAFVRSDRRRRDQGRTVMLDLRLFRLTRFRRGILAATAVSFGQLGMVFVLPLFFQAVLGYTALHTGVVLMPMAVGAFAGGPTAAWLTNRSEVRTAIILGMVLQASGIGLLGLVIGLDVSALTLAAPMVLIGLGVGMAAAQLGNVILQDVPDWASGQGSAAQGAFRRVGASFGIAVLGTLLAATLGSHVRSELTNVPDLSPAQVQQVATMVETSAGAALAHPCDGGALAQPLAQACNAGQVDQILGRIDVAFVSAIKRVAIVALVFVLGGAALAWRLPRRRDESEGDIEELAPVVAPRTRTT
jgi:EmrB/QacA subfamily drug resistance transporter